MNRSWIAVRPILWELLVFALAFSLFGALILTNHGALFTPSPEKEAEGFVSALAAMRYQGAKEALSQDLQQQIELSDLKQLHDALEASQQGIEDAHGQDYQEQGDFATAVVQVKFGNLQEREVEFPLAKEHGLWKVTSIDPLRSLASH
jgi:hypothetical protein